MKFLHLSDTHLRRDYSTNVFTRKLFDEVEDPTVRLKRILTEIKPENVDFALITGDLVHEGAREDYELFQEIWQEYMKDVPYYFCRGNHDKRAVFMEAMNVSPNEQNEYIQCSEFQGLRIISLDSAQDDHHEGKLSVAQMNQLTEWLAKPAPKGTLLLLHQPLSWEEAGIPTETPNGFETLIEHSDILGIFVGHIHQNTVMYYGGKPQFMTEAVAFGVDEYPNEAIFTDRTGYTICSLKKGQLFVYAHQLLPDRKQIGRVSKPILSNE